MGWLARLALVLVAACAQPAAGYAYGPIVYGLAVKAFGAFSAQAVLTDALARRAYARAARPGTCAERRASLVHILPDALRLGRYARDIYDHTDKLKPDSPKTFDLGDGIRAFYEPSGKRYAEVHIDPSRNEIDVVFEGTRLSVGSDLSTDIVHFVGIETAYYRWASELVGQIVREHPGMRVIVTGHSLGGGLVLYVVLHNPGVQGMAFDPAGLPWLTWLRTSRAERARTNAALTVIAMHNANHVEPLTAISLAHRTVLPGQLYFVETDAARPMLMHSQVRLVASLERLAASEAGGSACEGVLGVLAN